VKKRLVSLHSETLGKGKSSLIMLHGWGQESTQLRYLAEKLAAQRKVHLIDLPGFGKSEAPKKVWSSFDYAQRLIDYLDKENIERADFLGHSFGGKIALSLAIQHPTRIHRLVLLAPSGLRPYRSLKQNCRLEILKWAAGIAKRLDCFLGTQIFPTLFISRFGSADYKNAGVLRPILVRSVNEDLSPFLHKILAPTLILWGDKDTETPKEMGERMKGLISQSTLLRFPYHAHDLFKDTGAHLCAFHISPFLRKTV
jgi:pimeloyl-ACP methyl ester carboxylesterase